MFKEVPVYEIPYSNTPMGVIVTLPTEAELLKWLKLLKQEEISDIRKVYKSGVSDSVLETYRNYIRPA